MDNNHLAACVLADFAGYADTIQGSHTDDEIAAIASGAVAALVIDNHENRFAHDAMAPEGGYDAVHRQTCTLCNPMTDVAEAREALIEILIMVREMNLAA